MNTQTESVPETGVGPIEHRKSQNGIARLELSEVAKAALQAGKSYEEVSATLVEILTSDPAILQRFATDYVRTIAATVTNSAAGNMRFKMMTNLNKSLAMSQSPERVIALGQANLMAYPLPSGPLGQATKEDVLIAANRLATLAKETGRRSNWLQTIADRMPEGRCVADVLKEEDLASIWEAAPNPS